MDEARVEALLGRLPLFGEIGCRREEAKGGEKRSGWARGEVELGHE